ncbi:MAG TPA: MarC family protein [Candidatus Bathyarchaeia archaeon]|jgi:multiple antibiotic resistance protein|nr:MarC family protein [Candidatus Bathyarchaeia archaeon]
MSAIDDFLFNLLRASVALFVIVDPIGPVPIFAGLTKPMSPEEKRKVSRTAAIVGAVLLAVFALVGQEVLVLFGIALPSFQIAGGLVLLLLSIEIIFRGERFDKLALVSAEETAVFPIAFPLLVGPGAITLTMISIQSVGLMVAFAAIVLVMFVSWIVLRQTDRIYRVFGRTGSAVIARIMSLFIAAIAIQYVLAGVQFYYPPK